jgi:hypothetical protein
LIAPFSLDPHLHHCYDAFLFLVGASVHMPREIDVICVTLMVGFIPPLRATHLFNAPKIYDYLCTLPSEVPKLCDDLALDM